MRAAQPLPVATGGLSRRRQISGAALLVGGLPILTALLVPHRDAVSYATPMLLVLVLVVTVALIGGIRAALPAAVAGGLVLNWYFTPPFGTLTVDRPDQGLALAVYFGFATAVSVIVDLAARRTAEATRARAEARALSTLAGSALAGAHTLPELLERMRTTFGMQRISLLEAGTGTPAERQDHNGDSRADDWTIVESVARDEPDPAHVELRVPVGNNLLLTAYGPELFAEDKRVLRSFADAAATALEGRRLALRAQQSAQLEATNRVRTALLAAVGHDLRTPLASIKAAVTSLRQTDVEFTDPEREDLLETVETSTDRLQTLLANLLDASRVQADAVPVQLQPTGFADVIATVVRSLNVQHRQRLDLDLPDDLPDAVADPGLLERVVANLLSNALLHTPTDQRVQIVARALGAQLGCDIVDHGPGVPPGQREVMFTPFQRMSDRAPGGIGLGLAVARGFTEAMGGTLVPLDTDGSGLTMRVLLPRAAAMPTHDTATCPPTAVAPS